MGASENRNDRERYLELCTGQMRCRAMRPAVEEELSAHIQDQMEAYMEEGMEEKEAEMLAIKQMGDPVETGAAFDRVHRPEMDWKAAVMILVLAAAGGLIQYLMNGENMGDGIFRNYIVSTAAGIALMFAVCFADYTILGKYPHISWCVMAGMTMLVYFFTPEVNGVRRGGWMVMLLIPAFAGLVFYYRSQRGKGIIKALAWLAGTCFILFAAGCFTDGLLVKMWLCGGIVMLAFAVAGGWYGVKRRICLLLLGLPAAGAAAAALLALHDGGYRAMRIRAMLNPAAYESGAGYLRQQVGRAMANLKLVGDSSGNGPDMLIGSMREDYAFLWIVQRCGLAAGILLAVLLLALTGLLIYRIGKQANRLGAIAGVGCVFVFLLPVLVHILMNFGLFFSTSCSLPFVSMNGRQNISLYILMGLLLSIYRSSRIRPEPKKAAGLRFYMAR